MSPRRWGRRHNLVLAQFYQRLRRAGKPPKLALTATMRKLLIALNSSLKTGPLSALTQDSYYSAGQTIRRAYGQHAMSRNFEELDYRETPLGELSLRRRRMLSLGAVEIYEVKLGEAFLMSSLFHEVEEALAHLGLGELQGESWDVVVGGLGLGYTAAAALEHREVASLLIVDALEPVIEWHQRGLVPLGKKLTHDPRTTMLQADFFERAQSADGFDLEQSGRKFHAVLLDIDHSPSNLLHPRNAAFYQASGLHALAAHLHPGGVFALWSDDPPDGEFLGLLGKAFANARAHIVTFANPLTESDSASTVYVAGN